MSAQFEPGDKVKIVNYTSTAHAVNGKTGTIYALNQTIADEYYVLVDDVNYSPPLFVFHKKNLILELSSEPRTYKKHWEFL